MNIQNIWKPISFNPKWNDTNISELDALLPLWKKKREKFENEHNESISFIDKLKRKQAIETGIIERMYDLDRGITETFIEKGFKDSYLSHGDTNIPEDLLMDYLRDNYSAIDFVFDFVKNGKHLTGGYIKEMHSLITRHQNEIFAKDPNGNYVKIPLLKGEYKKLPNNPQRDGVLYNYCPPEQVGSEIDRLIDIYNYELQNIHIIIKSAFLHHAFVQIHPFQDGNGRLARLLASLALIKGGLFPLSIGRDNRAAYIDALEMADKNEYQPLIDVFIENQVSAIEQALTFN